MRHCNQCMWCSSVQAARREQHTNRKMYDWNNITVPFQRANCINIIITTHSVSHCRCNADQNRKTGQMGCYAANMSGVDDISLHPTVGPPSCCLVSPLGWIVKESTLKFLPSYWCHSQSLCHHLHSEDTLCKHVLSMPMAYGSNNAKWMVTVTFVHISIMLLQIDAKRKCMHATNANCINSNITLHLQRMWFPPFPHCAPLYHRTLVSD